MARRTFRPLPSNWRSLVMTRVLVTGSGGLAGVNFVRALRASTKGYYIVGTDFNKYHILYPDVDARYLDAQARRQEVHPAGRRDSEEGEGGLPPPPAVERGLRDLEQEGEDPLQGLPSQGERHEGRAGQARSRRRGSRPAGCQSPTPCKSRARQTSAKHSPSWASRSGSGRGTARAAG